MGRRLSRVLLASMLGLAGLGGCAYGDDASIAEERARVAGHRVEHDPATGEFVMRTPQGGREAVRFDGISEVMLLRMPASGRVDGRDLHAWIVQGRERTLTLPFFGVEAPRVVEVLAAGLPGFDVAAARHHAGRFADRDFDQCIVWATPERARDLAKGSPPPRGCEPFVAD